MMSESATRELEDTETGATSEPSLRVPLSAREGRGASPPDLLAPAAKSRISTLLIVKATLDLFFVSALAVGFSYFAFHPHFSGSLDYADAASVRGWVVDRAEPRRAVEVQLYIDGQFVAGGVADRPRPDVREKGYAPDERHGFVFDLNPPRQGGQEVRVYAVHTTAEGDRRTLQQIGRPLRFGDKQYRER